MFSTSSISRFGLPSDQDTSNSEGDEDEEDHRLYLHDLWGDLCVEREEELPKLELEEARTAYPWEDFQRGMLRFVKDEVLGESGEESLVSRPQTGLPGNNS